MAARSIKLCTQCAELALYGLTSRPHPISPNHPALKGLLYQGPYTHLAGFVCSVCQEMRIDGDSFVRRTK